MNTAIETTIRTLALSDGIPTERVEAGLAAMKMGTEREVHEPLYSLKEISRQVGFRCYSSLSRLKVQSVGVSYGGRLQYRLPDVVRYLRSAECTSIRAELRRKRREIKGGTQVAASA